MSAYGKPVSRQLHGYDTVRAFPEGSFPTYGPQAGISTATPPEFGNTHQLTPMGYQAAQSRMSYDDQTGPYLNVGSTPTPEITSWTPHGGPATTQLFVSITSLYELMTSSTPIFYLKFGSRKCQASLSKASQQGGVCQYTVTAEVPDFGTTGSTSSQVPVDMLMESGDGDVIDRVEVGLFTYVSGTQNGSDPSQDGSRKRKISDSSPELMKSPVKRTSAQMLRPKEEYGSAYGYSTSDAGSSYSPYLQASQSYGNLVPQYSRSIAGYSSQPSRHIGYGYANSNASPPTVSAQSPHGASWNSSYTRHDGLPSSVAMNRSALPSPASSANPPLIRTSTLQQTPSPASTPHGHHGQPFAPYSLFPHKAKLEINGDLDSMGKDWTEDEWVSKRRLVVFQRSQSGSTITTTFRAVSPEERPPHSICVSCIYWEEKQECFVTSVDTIHLLEQLVAARFTVEEKNRIRRNLEGFRPLTVSKGKQESEEFFKVIMAFPTPKPRNIEKDVKVFHWKDLASALKKIIGKYSASPSSTLPPAPPLLTPVSSTGYATEGSSAGMSYMGDHHGAMSPRSISGSTSSTAYAANIPARVLTHSPHNQNSLPLAASAPDLRVSLPQHPHETGHWQASQQHMQSSHQFPHLGPQSSRGSWDMSSYMDNNSAGAGNNSAPQPFSHVNRQLNYARNVADNAGPGVVGVPGLDNRLSRSLSSQQQQQQSHQMPMSRS